MDGYASDGAAMILGGMKVTVKAGLPRAIIADSEVIKNAPMEMIKAGYGDIIGKYSALNDWKLSKLINGEYFCSFVYDTTYQMILNVLNTAEGLLKREENSVNALMEALVVVGIMMSFAGSSRPASGSEHHLSHFFEIVGIIDNKPYFPHGIDVAYSTVITSEIREKLAKKPFRKERFTLSKEDYQKEMQRVYKSVAKACEGLQEKVGNYKNDKTKIYLEKEKEIKEILTECPSSIEIEKMLEKVKMDISEFYSLYGEEKIKDAIKYAKDLKDRYTVLWLNYDLGEN
jgi:glycerol-1-phosphate dehydrogenase [NAD(P)+]